MERIYYEQRMTAEELETVINSMEAQTGCKVYASVQEQVLLHLDCGSLPYDEAEVNRCSSAETGNCFYAETLDGEVYLIASPSTVHRGRAQEETAVGQPERAVVHSPDVA